MDKELLNAISLLMDEKLGPMQQDSSAVHEEIADLKQDVTGVKQEVAGLKQDVTGVKQEVTEVKQDVGGVKQDVTGVKQDVGGVKQEVAQLKQELVKTNIMIENEVIRRLDALMDGYMLSHEEITDLKRRVVAIEAKVY